MNNLKYTYHALDEVKHELEKEFKKTFSDEEAAKFISENMRRATYISEIMSEKGKVDRLFAYRRYCFVLDRYEDVVITVYKRENVHEEIRSLVQEMLFEKLADIEKSEQLLEEERLAADIAHQLHKELNKALGASFFTQVQELAAWDELKTIEKKLFEYRLRKSKLAKGIAAYI